MLYPEEPRIKDIIRRWDQADELYQNLRRYMPEDSKTLKLLYKPLTEGMFGTALRRARLMKYTKNHFPGVFNRAKQLR